MCVTVVKERTGHLRCFLAAKTHPFVGEETVDDVFDLYRGKALLLFSCESTPFNFMPLICFDYIYYTGTCTTRTSCRSLKRPMRSISAVT
jgi:hypothetical protein